MHTHKLGFSGEKIVKKRFRGILKNPPITPKLLNRFLKINSAQIVVFDFNQTLHNDFLTVGRQFENL